MTSGALLSPCRTYRYALWRHWGACSYAMFVGLNPSTADETADDPTIRRCIAFAKAWGYGGLCMTNLFAYRATQPEELTRCADPVGEDNDLMLTQYAKESAIVVACWGVHGKYRFRDAVVRALLPALHVLRLTKDGFPGHPLYLPKNLTPMAWA